MKMTSFLEIEPDQIVKNETGWRLELNKTEYNGLGFNSSHTTEK